MSAVAEPDARRVARDVLDLLEGAQSIMGTVTGKIGVLPDTPAMQRLHARASELYDEIKELWHDVNVATRSMRAT